MSDESDVHTNRRIDFFVLSIFPFGLFNGAQQSFGFRHSHTFSHLGCSLLLLGNYPFVFANGAVVELDEALGYLEEILVWFIRPKFDVEVER